MGSQRYISGALQEAFVLTEEQADHKFRHVEAIMDIQDEIADAVWPLINDGDLDETLRVLREITHRLSNCTMNLEAAFLGVERRP
jgi:hypothetical protein